MYGRRATGSREIRDLVRGSGDGSGARREHRTRLAFGSGRGAARGRFLDVGRAQTRAPLCYRRPRGSIARFGQGAHQRYGQGVRCSLRCVSYK